MPYAITRRVCVSDELFGTAKLEELIDNNAVDLWGSFAVEHDRYSGEHTEGDVPRAVGVAVYDSRSNSYAWAPWSVGFVGEPEAIDTHIVRVRWAWHAEEYAVHVHPLADDGAIWLANYTIYTPDRVPTGTSYVSYGTEADYCLVTLANATTHMPTPALCTFGLAVYPYWS